MGWRLGWDVQHVVTCTDYQTESSDYAAEPVSVGQFESWSISLLEMCELRGTQAHLQIVSVLWWKITDGQAELSERQHSSSEKNVSRFPPHRTNYRHPMRRRARPGAKPSQNSFILGCWSTAAAPFPKKDQDLSIVPHRLIMTKTNDQSSHRKQCSVSESFSCGHTL